MQICPIVNSLSTSVTRFGENFPSLAPRHGPVGAATFAPVTLVAVVLGVAAVAAAVAVEGVRLAIAW